MAVRIQLASNFQVIELTYDKWEDIDSDALISAQKLVNELGQNVHNDIKTKENNPVEEKKEMATEGQINVLINLGIDEKVAKRMTKQQAWRYIKDHT